MPPRHSLGINFVDSLVEAHSTTFVWVSRPRRQHFSDHHDDGTPSQSAFKLSTRLKLCPSLSQPVGR